MCMKMIVKAEDPFDGKVAEGSSFTKDLWLPRGLEEKSASVRRIILSSLHQGM